MRLGEELIADNGRPEAFGPRIDRLAGLPAGERHTRAAELAPILRGLASSDRPQVGHYTDADVVLDFLASAGHPRPAALGTSCPAHFLRTNGRPRIRGLAPGA